MTEQVEITDAKGRKLKLRRLTVVDQVKLIRAIGPAQSTNEPYVNMVQVAASVASIDGVPTPPVGNEAQIDGLLSRLGDEGFAAVMAYFAREVARIKAEAEAAIDGGEAGDAGVPLPPSGQ